MSESGSAVLSRDELEALLEAAAAGALREEQAQRGSRPYGGRSDPSAQARRPGRLAPLLRLLDEFSEEQGRMLSTLHQLAISFSATGWEELTPREFAASLLDHDRVAALELSPGGHRAYLLVGRGLLFGWLCLAFGSRHPEGGRGAPERPYTRIEEGFLRRVAGELARQLERTWQPRQALTARLLSLEEPERIAEDEQGPMLGVSFDVKGMGPLCRLRVLLPPAAFAATATAAADAVVPGKKDAVAGAIASPLLEMQRIEDVPRFRAERGTVGGRLAARITERL
jgi:flagellar motor switch protein FliM